MTKFITSNEFETENLGFEFAKKIKENDIVALNGDLGVGKTAFIRGMVKYLVPDARVQSPTYTLVNTYKGKTTVYHFDMYRIEDEDSLYSSGYSDYIDSDAICIIEWFEKISDFAPEHNYKINIHKTDDDENKRIIEIEEKNDNSCN